jgi:hypothetical protein
LETTRLTSAASDAMAGAARRAGERAPPGQQPLPGEVERDGGERVGGHLDADGGVRRAVQHQHRGGPADAVLRHPDLADDAAVDQVVHQAGDGGLAQAGGGRDVGAGAGALRAHLPDHHGQVGGADVGEVGGLWLALRRDHR